MKSYSFYDKTTGLFNGRVFIGGEDSLPVNTPANCIAIEGQFDHLSQKVDRVKGAVIAYKPPQPENTEFEKFSWDTNSKRWIASPTVASMSRDARLKRSALLNQSDWTQMPDAELTAEEKTRWIAYRKALRDLPAQNGFPNSITWPIPPNT